MKSELEKQMLKLNVLYNIDIEIDPNDFYKSTQKVKYVRNAYGLRDDCSSPKDINIVTIGGSTTDQRYINFHNTYQFLLQTNLNKSKRDICISNAGVDGHTSLGHLLSINEWFPLIQDFNPKYYLFYVGINDAVIIHQNKPKDQITNSITMFAKLKITENSYLYWLYNKLKNTFFLSDQYGILSHRKDIKNYYKYDTVKNNDNIKNDLIQNALQFKENLSDAFKVLMKKENRIICVTQPNRFVENSKGIANAIKFKDKYLTSNDLNLSLEIINRNFKEICKKNMALFIDTNRINFTDDDFYDFVHLNNKGNKKLANFLFKNLDKFINVDS